MANEFIARNGIRSLQDSQITGSLEVSTTVTASGFSGDGSQLTGLTVSAVSSFLNEGNDNYVITSTGTNGQINAEANLQFDGSQQTFLETQHRHVKNHSPLDNQLPHSKNY